MIAARRGRALAFATFAGASLSIGASRAPAASPAMPPADTSATVLIDAIDVPGRRGDAAGVLFPFARAQVAAGGFGDGASRDVSHRLAGLPGVHVRRSGAPGAPAFLSLRGASPEGVLVLLDGERVNRAQGGGVDLSRFALSGMAGGEVIRGGASILYGANAVGGAVALRRFPASLADESRVALEFGSLGARAATAVHAKRFASGWARLLVRGAASDGDFRYEDRERAASRVRLNAGTDSRLAEFLVESRAGGGVWRASLRASRDRSGSPGVVEFPTPGAESDESGLGGHLEFARGAANAAVALSASARGYRDAGAPLGPVDARHDARAASIRAGRRFSGRRGSADLGLEARSDALDSTTDGSRGRRTGSLFGSVARRVPRTLTWSVGARADAPSGFRRVVSSRAGVSLDAAGVVARMTAGTSYRLPSFDDLFWPASGLAVGNPDLRPERSGDWNMGVDWSGGRGGRGGAQERSLRASFDVYEQRVRDLIQWNPGPGGVWRPANVSRATIRGAEISAALRGARDAYGVEANASLLSARDRSGEPNTDGRALPGRPRRFAALRAWRAISPRVAVESAWRFVGSVPRTAANTKHLDAYAVGSVAVSAAPHRALAVRGEIENVGAARYEDYYGFPLPGRLYRVSVEWRRGGGEPR